MKKFTFATLAFLLTPVLLAGQGTVDGNGYSFQVRLGNGKMCLDAVVSAGPFTFSKEAGCVSYGKLKDDEWHRIIDLGNLDFYIRYRSEKDTHGIKAHWKGNELSGWRINIYDDGSIRERGDFMDALQKRISEKGL